MSSISPQQNKTFDSTNPDKFILIREDLPNDARYKIHTFLSLKDMSSYSIFLSRFGQNLQLFPTHPLLKGISARLILRQTGFHQTINPIHHRLIRSAISGHDIKPEIYEIPQDYTPEPVSIDSLIALFKNPNAGYDAKREIFESMILKLDLSNDEKIKLINLVLEYKTTLPFSEVRLTEMLERIHALEAATPAQLDGLLALAVTHSGSVDSSNLLLTALLNHLVASQRFAAIPPAKYSEFLETLVKNNANLSGFRLLFDQLPQDIRNTIHVQTLTKVIRSLNSNPQKTAQDYSRIAPYFATDGIRDEVSEMENIQLRALATLVINSKNPEIFRAFSNAAAAADGFNVVKPTIRLAINNQDLFKYSDEFVQLLNDSIVNDGVFA